MKKYFSIVACAIMALLNSCTAVDVNPGEVGIKIAKPILFGRGGIIEEPVQPGLEYTWLSTDYVTFPTIPVIHEEKLDDIMSNENTPIDYVTHITTVIDGKKAAHLMQNYGLHWYENNLQQVYKTYVMEEVSKYSPLQLMSEREVNAEMDKIICKKMNEYIDSLSSKAEFPVRVTQVVLGRAKPNDEQLKQMNLTAAAIQAKQTQERKKEMEEARKAAEEARAEADKAYMQKMNMSANDFLMLKIIEKSNPNIDVIMGGGAQSMFNVRR